jgi:hypothetical protein
MQLAAANNPARVERHLAAALAGSLFASFLAIVLVLAVRRLAGALDQSLSAWSLIGAVVVCAIAAVILRLALLESAHIELSTGYSVPSTNSSPSLTTTNRSRTALPGFLFALPGVASLLFLATLTLPGSGIGGVLASWLLLIAAETASWMTFYHRPRNILHTFQPHRKVRARIVSQPEATEPTEEIPAGLVQQLTRVREDAGESLHALALAEIPAGDNFAVIHLAFCPPLGGAPALTAHAFENDDATVKITQAETFGTRIEVRLPRASAEPRSVLVEVLGSVKASRSA